MRLPRIVAAAVATLACVAIVALPAQVIAPGTLIRVTTPAAGTTPRIVQTGPLDRIDGDSILLARNATPIFRGPGTVIQRADGYHGHGLAGFGIGALVGVLAGEGPQGDDHNLGGQLTLLAAVGAGLLVGAAIRTPTWVPVDSGAIALQAGAVGPGLGLQLRLADHQ